MQQFIINLTQVKIINIRISPKIELIFGFSLIMNSIYFLKIKKIAENKLFCVCALLTERQHTCDKQKHEIIISYNSLPPRGGGGGHCKPQFYYLHQLNANKTVMKSREN